MSSPLQQGGSSQGTVESGLEDKVPESFLVKFEPDGLDNPKVSLLPCLPQYDKRS